MDLSAVQFNRRISRLHATLRYNVHACDWEVQVRGRNGLELDRAVDGADALVDRRVVGRRVRAGVRALGDGSAPGGVAAEDVLLQLVQSLAIEWSLAHN